MNVDLKDLLAALPDDIAPEGLPLGLPGEELRRILADLSMKPVPVGSLHRLWAIGELSAHIALAYLALWIRGWFADADAREQRLMEANLRLALKTFQRLPSRRHGEGRAGAGGLPRHPARTSCVRTRPRERVTSSGHGSTGPICGCSAAIRVTPTRIQVTTCS